MPLVSDYSSDKSNPLLVPTIEEWETMTLMEQQKVEDRIIEALDSQTEFMGETTDHFDIRSFATQLLRRFYSEQNKQVFVASDLYTLYPGEEAFYPDLLVVFNVPDHSRSSWIVANEKRGLDFVLEILSKKTRQNDQVRKLNLYARVGIPEYFMFDPERFLLNGYRLDGNIYREIPRDEKGIFSSQLQLYLKNDDVQLRFCVQEGVEIPFSEEIIATLNNKLAKKEKLLLDLSKERDDLAERCDNISKERDEEKEKAKQAQAEIERLKALLESR